MKLTNKNNLPDIIYKAVQNTVYQGAKNSFASATGLIKPAYMTALERHLYSKGVEIQEDVSDRLWALIGTSIHYIIEKSQIDNDNVFTEELLTAEIEGEKISGRPDYYDIKSKTIYDIKVTSAWTIVYGSRFKEWEQQLNIYSYLFGENGIDVSDLKVIAILRDWSQTKAISDSNYPQINILEIKLKLWDKETQYNFIKSRILDIKTAIDNLDMCPVCTPEERWQKDDKYAVMKEGRKSALRVLDNEDEAKAYIANDEKNKGLSIVYRPGERIRCKSYCAVSKYCKDWNNERQ